MLAPGLAGALAALQLGIGLRHVRPEGVLPLAELLFVPDYLLCAQPPVGGQRHEAEMHVRRLLIHVYHGGEEGARVLAPADELHCPLEKRPDPGLWPPLEELRARRDEHLNHPDAVLARAAARLPDEPFGLLAVAPGGLCQVKVQPAAPRVDVRVARVLLLPPLIVGLDVMNAGALVFCKTQYRILRLRH